MRNQQGRSARWVRLRCAHPQSNIFLEIQERRASPVEYGNFFRVGHRHLSTHCYTYSARSDRRATTRVKTELLPNFRPLTAGQVCTETIPGPWSPTHYPSENIGDPPKTPRNREAKSRYLSTKTGRAPHREKRNKRERDLAHFCLEEHELVAAQMGPSESHIRSDVTHARARVASQWQATALSRDHSEP